MSFASSPRKVLYSHFALGFLLDSKDHNQVDRGYPIAQFHVELYDDVDVDADPSGASATHFSLPPSPYRKSISPLPSSARYPKLCWRSRTHVFQKASRRWPRMNPTQVCSVRRGSLISGSPWVFLISFGKTARNPSDLQNVASPLVGLLARVYCPDELLRGFVQ